MKTVTIYDRVSTKTQELAQVGFHQAPEVKDSSKVRALELMGKHLGMFELESSGSRVQIVRTGQDLLL